MLNKLENNQLWEVNGNYIDYVLSKGYHKVDAKVSNNVWGTELLEESYPINVCSCGDHYKAE